MRKPAEQRNGSGLLTYCKECNAEWSIVARVTGIIPIKAGGEYSWKEFEYDDTIHYECYECGALSVEYSDIAGGEYA